MDSMDKPKRAALSDEDLSNVPSFAEWPTSDGPTEPARSLAPEGDVDGVAAEPTTTFGDMPLFRPAAPIATQIPGAEDTTSLGMGGGALSGYEPTTSITDPAAVPGGIAASEATGESKPETRKRHPFTRAMIATVASTFVPGLGLVTSRRRGPKIAGWAIMSVFLVALIGSAGWAATHISAAAALAVNSKALTTASWVIAGLALLWVAIIVGTHLVRRPNHLTGQQRVVGALGVALLSFGISAPLAVAARYASDQANLVSKIFGQGVESDTTPDLEGDSIEEIWANKSRLNILLLGGDTDSQRIETIQNRGILTDTIMVASIDTKTGSMVIVQLPRNMAKTPFPEGSELDQLYPQGWYDGVDPNNLEYMLNTIWKNLPLAHPEAFPNSTYPGADALKLGVGETLGLDIDYFALLNIDGLQKLIDAMGGVTVNINERLPMGGTADNCVANEYLKPGPNQELDGRHAMWYGRSRCSTDDYNRMARQSCLVNAIINQADPQVMVTRYEAIASAGSDMVITDIPESALPAMVELALRTKAGSAKRVLFQHGVNGYVTTDPDFDMMRDRVATAIGKSEAADASAKPSASSSTKSTTSSSSQPATTSSSQPRSGSTPDSGSTSGSSGSTPKSTTKKSTSKPTESATGTDLEDACAYNPGP